MKIIKWYVLFFVLVSSTMQSVADTEKSQKIIGLISVRNEEQIIEQCLRAVAYYVDSLIILDDKSTDNTLAILKTLCNELPIEQIICCPNSSWEHRSESFNKQKLLEAGRKHNGTHFLIIDADEMFTACCKEHNFLRTTIHSLKPGQALAVQMPHLWRSLEYYRDDHTRWSPSKCWCACIFCDDSICDYSQNAKKSIPGFIHINRLPSNRKSSEPDILLHNLEYSLMHFRFVNWNNIMIKRAWYMCLELIRAQESLQKQMLVKRAQQINYFYTFLEDFSEEGMILKPVNPAWFDYPFFDSKPFLADLVWRKKAVLNWFEQYGKPFFEPLDIWNIAWNE